MFNNLSNQFSNCNSNLVSNDLSQSSINNASTSFIKVKDQANNVSVHTWWYLIYYL